MLVKMCAKSGLLAPKFPHSDETRCDLKSDATGVTLGPKAPGIPSEVRASGVGSRVASKEAGPPLGFVPFGAEFGRELGRLGRTRNDSLFDLVPAE